MANRNIAQFLNHSDGTVLNAAAGYTATFNSEWTTLKGDWLGIAVTNLNASGSSMTLIPALQVSPDGGTTAYDYPADKNSQTKAAFADMGSDDATASTISPSPSNSNSSSLISSDDFPFES